jgi:nitroimidazol reductase NimA-like FMN-containing flavoprotein (pyridoxamine 5'-phosphate oxidase superfamily)
MRSNPRVCVEVDEVRDLKDWICVVVFGRYEELPDVPGWRQYRDKAHRLLQEHGVWWEPGAASWRLRRETQPLAPIFYRIRIDTLTGRRARLEAFELHAERC